MIAFPSPNFSDRRGGALPSLIVIHYTAMASCAEARARLCAPEHEVSAHWLLSEAGQAEALTALLSEMGETVHQLGHITKGESVAYSGRLV